jgi:phage baseplate assembly protein W
MASLKFDNLKKSTNLKNQNFTYSDLHLDLTWDYINRDIVLDYDTQAIKNSIINIFNTSPGERFLVPEFGSSVYRHIFEPITDFTAQIIGNTIYVDIKKWEPRVEVKNINVVGNIEEHEYDITLTLVFPNLKNAIELAGILSQEGFKEVFNG